MITIDIVRNKNNEIIGFTTSGHAYADEPGRDIVCAAVSMLTQTIVLGLYEVLEVKAAYSIKHGYLTCSIPEDISREKRQQVNILFETMVVGLKNIQENYCQYIDLHDKEV
ncbi:putative ribosomal protein [Clostridium aceticum]|uniref:Ribosomal processing cysteine protease Prp n=1 Tax=Clostridium aceticum TaxID=84022 RepID=A0A0D8IFL8_9CLOT|nr:ribosomal-processing cysteine protease Prp [Clostridium aceticum]AKL95105.1 putative ribosomal protein [Clostridium aceticum]KJF27986.1 hypothetical protein TZ02_05330 [Clostridium aceticum]